MEQARAVLSAWIDSPDGQRDAYRPRELILPSQFASKASWERYLDELRRRRPAVLADILPDLTGVALVLDADPEFIDVRRVNVRAAIENGAQLPSRQAFADFEPSLFQVGLQLTLPTTLHRPLRLDRVQPSYRFKDWLEYPAMGLNCGIQTLAAGQGLCRIGASWAPQCAQPRVDSTVIEGLPTRYSELREPNCDTSPLLMLPDRYDAWIAAQALVDAGEGLPPEIADKERRAHALDIEAYRRESGYIRAGIQLLLDSRVAAHAMMTRGSSAHGPPLMCGRHLGKPRVPLHAERRRLAAQALPHLRAEQFQPRRRERIGVHVRYDPIRSTVEHDALRRRRVNLAGEAADLKIAHPDLCPEYENAELRRVYERRVADDLARFSGLDLGSMSEVNFPADLAFIVHRRGMTEDLGNISSVWRDQSAAFLRYLVARRELRCGSGTLCEYRGGACPACITIPETSCISGNQLLLRAALLGGRSPL
jgi:hypothetical protein